MVQLSKMNCLWQMLNQCAVWYSARDVEKKIGKQQTDENVPSGVQFDKPALGFSTVRVPAVVNTQFTYLPGPFDADRVPLPVVESLVSRRDFGRSTTQFITENQKHQ